MTGSRNAPGDEPDLAALIFRVLPRLGALEEPVLRDAGLSMWEYAILTEVASGAAVSQKELSRRTRRDPTRLGRHLDELVSRGLVGRERSQDQRDNRHRTVAARYGPRANQNSRGRASPHSLARKRCNAPPGPPG